MCGRFLLTSPAQAIAEAFGVEPPVDLAPRWNIAPGQSILAVRADDTGARALAELRWGLVPWWSGEPPRGAAMINARSETAAATPAFRDAFRGRRCLVPADGFYEWQAISPAATLPAQADLFPPASGVPSTSPPDGTRTYRLRGEHGRSRAPGAKQAYVIGVRDEAPFAMAGLWERWRPRDGGGAPVESCAILTTAPNALVEPIHDRMPVILPRSAWATWLDRSVRDVEGLVDLLRPFPGEAMRAEAVGAWVNDPRHDDPRCLAPG